LNDVILIGLYDSTYLMRRGRHPAQETCSASTGSSTTWPPTARHHRVGV